jgi:hippurate hydrolase
MKLLMSAALAICATAVAARADTPAVPQAARARVDRMLASEYDRLAALYFHLHRNPELSSRETKTAARLARELAQAGYEVTSGVGGTGVVGVLRNGAGPTVMVRAEMDALPIEEATGLPHRSRVRGVMHACAHDLHMAAVVGTARVLARTRDLWRGTLVVVGQPAEETLQGAAAMIRDGLFERFPRPSYGLAVHVNHGVVAGTVSLRSGAALASAASGDVVFRGKGGHGARPHEGIDVFTQAAQFVLALQTLTGREVDPTEAAVISVGAMNGGTKHNVLPEQVRIQLTVRAATEETRIRLQRRIRESAEALARAARAPAPSVEFREEVAALYNDPQLVAAVGSVLRAALGADRVVDGTQRMSADDFAEYGRQGRFPIVQIGIGSRAGRDAPAVPTHSPAYAPAVEPTLETGVRVLVLGVLAVAGQN